MRDSMDYQMLGLGIFGTSMFGMLTYWMLTTYPNILSSSGWLFPVIGLGASLMMGFWTFNVYRDYFGFPKLQSCRNVKGMPES